MTEIVNVCSHLDHCSTSRKMIVTCKDVCKGARRVTRTVTRRLSTRKIGGVMVRGITGDRPSCVVTSVFHCGKLVVNSPACDGRVFPRMRSLLSGVLIHRIGKHCLNCFNSFT